MNIELSIKKQCQNLSNTIKELSEEHEILSQKNIEMKDAINSDTEILKLQAELKQKEKAISNFRFRDYRPTQSEQEAIDDWAVRHAKIKHSSDETINYTYSFTPTTIGTVKKIICSCGEEFCIKGIE